MVTSLAEEGKKIQKLETDLHTIHGVLQTLSDWNMHV